MRNRFVWAGALALAIGATSQVETKAAYTNVNGTIITNGTIIITTRAANDNWFVTQSSAPAWDPDDPRGPGFTPGDSAMGELLGDHGYSVHMLPDKALSYFNNGFLGTTKNAFGADNNPSVYYNGQLGPTASSGASEGLSAMLVVISGSGSSADVAPPNPYGIPIVCGEHAVLGDSGPPNPPGSHSEIFLYSNKTDSSNKGATAGLYMKVLLPNHPIMQGIPLDAQNRVKIWRDPYPDENAHVLAPIGDTGGGLGNYVVSWTCVNLGTAHPATDLQIIGVLDSDNNQAVFATLERGGTFGTSTTDTLSPWVGYTKAPARMVHFFVCENGSGNSRRSFNALTVWGRIIFLRTCQWAMEETVSPFQGLGVIDVGLVSPSSIRLGWTGSIHNNYRIDGTTSLLNPNWLPIVDSITNNGDLARVTRTLNIASAPQAVFMRVAALP
jgi:hypothetical protein